MSVQALGWVFDHSPTQGTDRLVLLAIANHAGRDPEEGGWEAWPGTETIQREAGLDRHRTVRDALARLVSAGALDRLVNGAPDERVRKDRRSNLYRIRLDHGRTCDVPRCGWCGGTRDDLRGDAGTSNGGTRDDRTGGRDASTKPLVQPSTEPEEQPRGAAVEALRLVEPPGEIARDGFEEFWSAYPRKIGKPEARKAWAASAKVRPRDEELLGLLAPWVAYWRSRGDERFVPHPSTWLRREGWNDAPPKTTGHGLGPGSNRIEDAWADAGPSRRIR